MQKISAPSLGSALYGKNIQDLMVNIDNNFTEILDGGFSKGERGDSVKVVRINLSENTPETSAIIEAMKLALRNEFALRNDTPGQINKIDVFDHFNNPGYISFICTEDGTKLSSLPYIFKDMRFETMGKFDSKNDLLMYENQIDYSCVLYYVDGTYNITHEFPTLYYDNGFKWKINGNFTGLIAQGPQGLMGESEKINIVMVNRMGGEATTCKIVSVLHEGEYKSVIDSNNHEHECSKYGVNINSAVIAVLDEDGSHASYICDVYKLGEEMVVNCISKNIILTTTILTENDIKKCWEDAVKEIEGE